MACDGLLPLVGESNLPVHLRLFAEAICILANDSGL